MAGRRGTGPCRPRVDGGWWRGVRGRRPAAGRTAGIGRGTAVLTGLCLVLATAAVTWGLATGALGWRPGAPAGVGALERDQGFDNLVRALNLIRTQYVQPPDMARVYAGAIAGAVRALRDPYSAYFGPKAYAELIDGARGRYSGIGIQVEVGLGEEPVVVRVFPGSPAATTRAEGAPAGAAPGLRPGDRLVAVGGRPLRGLGLPQVAARIQGPVGSTVQVQVARTLSNGRVQQQTFRLVRRPVTIVTVSSRMLPHRVGYLAVSGFNAQTPREVAAALERLRAAGMRGLVLDLRNDPGGVLDAAVATGAFFLPPGVVATLHGRTGTQRLVLHRTQPLGVPVVVLVNRYTASAAEVLAGAIQDDGVAPLVGQRTFGKGIVQRVFPLAGGAGLRLTVARYRTPRGQDLGGRGLEPNVAVPAPATPADDGVPAHDPPLRVALALLARTLGDGRGPAQGRAGSAAFAAAAPGRPRTRAAAQ
jgi:carboxyl-terminal processing protease